MIIGCPACRRQYRLDDARVRPGARMRCTRCGHLFEPRAAAPQEPPADRVVSVPARAPVAAPPSVFHASSPAAPPTSVRTPSPVPSPWPVAAPPAPALSPAALPASAAGARATGNGRAPIVILADAGRPFGPSVKATLQDLGCDVRTVADGSAAFRMAVAERPALIVVSVHLAGLSGIAICEGVKNSPHLKAIRVAIVGSDLSADLFNRDTALAYGADLFLEEAIPEARMREALAEVLRPDDPGPE